MTGGAQNARPAGFGWIVLLCTMPHAAAIVPRVVISYTVTKERFNNSWNFG